MNENRNYNFREIDHVLSWVNIYLEFIIKYLRPVVAEVNITLVVNRSRKNNPRFAKEEKRLKSSNLRNGYLFTEDD